MSFKSEATEFRMQCIFWQILLWRFIKIKLTKRSIILVSRLIQPDIWSDNRLNCHNWAKNITKTTLTKESGFQVTSGYTAYWLLFTLFYGLKCSLLWHIKTIHYSLNYPQQNGGQTTKRWAVPNQITQYFYLIYV